MANILKFQLITIILFLFFHCKKDCPVIVIDRNVKLIVINTNASEDISASLSEDNFTIRQEDLPGIGIKFQMDFGTSPINTLVETYNCKSNRGQKYSTEFVIRLNNEQIGKIRVDFALVENECDECNYTIENIDLIEIDGEVSIQEFNNQVTLFLN